jgi:hypothetical protein
MCVRVIGCEIEEGDEIEATEGLAKAGKIISEGEKEDKINALDRSDNNEVSIGKAGILLLA